MSFDDKPIDPGADLGPDPALRHALDQWPRPKPRAQFGQELREKFLAAPFEEGVVGEQEPEDLGPVPVVAPSWGNAADTTGRPEGFAGAKRKPWRTVISIVAIAAAVLLVTRWPAPSGWRVAASSDFIVARVDGRDYSPKESARLAAALAPGSVIEVEGGALDLVLDRRVALSLASGCALTLVEVPEPEVLDALWLNQQRGSLAVATGPDFPGASMRIQTPDSEIRVTGTQFAVDVIAGSGTCVCCREGNVSVFDVPLLEDPLAEGTPEHKVAQGEMRFVFHDHRPVKIGPSIAEHIAPIESLRQLWAGAH